MKLDLHPLAAHVLRLSSLPMPELCDQPGRGERLRFEGAGLLLDLTRQRLDAQALQALLGQAEAVDLAGGFRRLIDGEEVNPTESRPALHTALRSALGDTASARSAHAEALAARGSMEALARELEASAVTDIVSVGIGGSDLGPRLVVDALRERAGSRFRLHFLSNVDGSGLQRLLPQLDPARTAVVLVSKSFGTQETLLNGEALRAWFGDASRIYAVSASGERAAAFGIAPERQLPMWDWVGGRYSLWSPVGWSIRLALGAEAFDGLLAGAAAMDTHVREAPLAANLPVLHALAAVWNRNLLGIPTQAVLAYDERLNLLPAFLQQLVMESLGKRVRLDGSEVLGETVPVIWGGTGTNSQHSFFQALHQGTQVVAADFIGVLEPDHDHLGHHRALLANLLAQCEALSRGRDSHDPHRHYPGGRPCSLILLPRLEPRTLGALLALYEHSVYAQSLLWGINAFDQWGVELGKQLASELLPAIERGAAAGDALTQGLLERLPERLRRRR